MDKPDRSFKRKLTREQGNKGPGQVTNAKKGIPDYILRKNASQGNNTPLMRRNFSA
jgi:hypothetical protein